MKTMLKIETATGIFLLGVGLSCIFWPKLDASVFYYIVALIVTLSALALWYMAVKKRRGLDFLEAGAATVIAGLFWAHQAASHELILMFFAFYMFFCGLNELIQWGLDLKDRAPGNWHHAVLGLLYLALAGAAFLFRKNDVTWVMRYFGLYLLIQAVQLFMEIYFTNHPKSSRSYTFKNWVSLPVYIVSFLPGLTLHMILKRKYNKQPVEYNSRKNDEEVNLRVCIHSGLTGDKILGHMTFAYKGIMYSYGNYDVSEEKFFRTVGPGIFFTVPADIYINNSCIYEKSTIFEYGLHITGEQEAKLQRMLDQILAETYRWYTPIEQEASGRLNFKEYESNYSCRLAYRTGAKFRKFYGTQWKTYWILGDNCSLFAEDILSRIGCHIVHKSGIISPGEYFEFFEEAYQDPTSNVITKSWHDASVPSTLFNTLA